jgi:isopenicillin N synthase-like dioxygenase
VFDSPVTASAQTVPVIDLGPLRSGSRAGLESVARAIGNAARDIGFFAVANHGIAPALIDAVYAAARAFFALPEAVKDRVAIENSPHYLGFARLAKERLDPSLAGDVKESFNFGRDRAADDPGVVAGIRFVGVNQWPDLPGFRPVLNRYHDAMTELTALVHRAIAVDLGLAPDYFVPLYGDALSSSRMLHYPPHPGQFDGSQYGAGPHTDYGSISLLAQDETGGLEVRRRDGDWIAVDPVPDTFVCNIGDAMMRWTNDVYVSNAHRVVNRSGHERYSIVFFGMPDADALIDCIPSCMPAGAPARYPPVTFGDFLYARVAPTHGQTPI